MVQPVFEMNFNAREQEIWDKTFGYSANLGSLVTPLGTLGIRPTFGMVPEPAASLTISPAMPMPGLPVIDDRLNSSSSDNKFNGQKDTKSNSQSEAFRNAKDQNGIPRSQQPDQTYTVPDKNTGQPLTVYEFTNSQGKKVTIRKDIPVTYPDGGQQGPHFNAGPSGGKLKQHHEWKWPEIPQLLIRK